ncbi:hypothetical protein C0U41_29750, partial [Klebsiella pneumoniae]
DGVIQGKSVRLILKKDARIEEIQQHGDMPPLQVPQVSDGVIQGKSVRLILKKDARIEEIQQHGDMPPLQV